MAEMTPGTLGIIYPIASLPLNNTLPDKLAVDGFRLKDEFHITLANPQYVKRIGHEREISMRRAIERQPQFELEYLDILYAISKAKNVYGQSVDRTALVAPVISPDVERSLGEIAASLQIPAPNPFLHVTVFTKPDTTIAARGIGIDSPSEWRALTPVPRVIGWQQ